MISDGGKETPTQEGRAEPVLIGLGNRDSHNGAGREVVTSGIRKMSPAPRADLVLQSRASALVAGGGAGRCVPRSPCTCPAWAKQQHQERAATASSGHLPAANPTSHLGGSAACQALGSGVLLRRCWGLSSQLIVWLSRFGKLRVQDDCRLTSETPK